MKASLQALMDGLIDYAGLFPPAGLGMDAALASYVRERRGPQAEWLGRFVLPVSRLEEFGAALASLSAGQTGDTPWRLAAIVDEDLQAGLEAIDNFERDHAGKRAPIVIESLEMKLDRPEAIRQAIETIPSNITAYVEIPIREDPGPFLEELAEAGASAKVRTGGVRAEEVPTPFEMTRFLVACHRLGLRFKATAGLHHPFRGWRMLTGVAGGPEVPMHGFLNVFLAAAFVGNGMEADTLTSLLDESSPAAFFFSDEGAVWRDYRLDTVRLKETRSGFAMGFGSCSVQEPREALAEAGLL